jgi:hypothetical protein
MDELTVNKTKYISSKRAAKESGYTQDYIGQSIRQGKLDAQKVGRGWYVSESSIQRFRNPQAGLAGRNAELETSVQTGRSAIPILPHTIEYSLPRTWSKIEYKEDDTRLYPISDERDEEEVAEMAIIKVLDPRDGASQTERNAQSTADTKLDSGKAAVDLPVSTGVRTISRSIVARGSNQRSKNAFYTGSSAVAVMILLLLLGILMPIVS